MADIRHPILYCTKPLQKEYSKHSTIKIESQKFTIGRSLANTEVIACVAISRFHCSLEQHADLSWFIRDSSRYGIFVNGKKIIKDENVPLKDQDVIQFDIAGDFVYKFCLNNAGLVTSRKRKHSDTCNHYGDGRIQEAKDKFDSTQSIEMDNMKTKLNIAKKKQFNLATEKASLEKILQDKTSKLKCFYNQKILDLKGREDEIQQQKDLLLKQSDEEKNKLQAEMNGKIATLEVTLSEQNLHEKALEEENKLLLERLKRERDEFQQRLEEVTKSKEHKLECLEKQLQQKEQELRDEKNRMESLVQVTEELKTEREEQLKKLRDKMTADEENKMKDIESLKLQMKMQEHFTRENRELAEMEYRNKLEELNRKDEELKQMNEQLVKRLAEQAEMELARKAAEQQLEQQRKLMEESLKEREEEKQKLQKLLMEKSKQSDLELQNLQREMTERESKLQEQAERDKECLTLLLAKENETCNSAIKELQEVKSKMIVPQDKNVNESATKESSYFIDLTNVDCYGPSTSGYGNRVLIANEEKAAVLQNVNKIMESELQCSICSDLFVEATTLNCSHTFCKHCIVTWKKKKTECPFCRARITSECRSIVLDSFIDKMVESMDAEVKARRAQTLKERQATEAVRVPTTIQKVSQTQTTVSIIPPSIMGFTRRILPSGVILNQISHSTVTARGTRRGTQSPALRPISPQISTRAVQRGQGSRGRRGARTQRLVSGRTPQL